MKRWFWSVFVVVALLLTAAPLFADEEAAKEMLAISYRVSVKPGHGLDFEKAYRNHLDMHKGAGDTWRWEVWQVVAGDDVGDIIIRSPMHSWESLDGGVEIEGDREHIDKEVMPHVCEMSSTVTKWMLDISRWPEVENPKMVDVTLFTLRYDAVPEFLNTIKKLHTMIGEKELPRQYSWGMVEVGGSGAEMVLAFPRSGWADFAPKSPDIWQLAAEVFGEYEARTMRTNLGKAIVAEENFVVLYRPDLSYVPEG